MGEGYMYGLGQVEVYAKKPRWDDRWSWLKPVNDSPFHMSKIRLIAEVIE